MSWMHSNMFSPSQLWLLWKLNIPGKTSLLEFALFIKFIASHKRIQIDNITYIYVTFSHYFWAYNNQLPKWVPQVTKHPVYMYLYNTDFYVSKNIKCKKGKTYIYKKRKMFKETQARRTAWRTFPVIHVIFGVKTSWAEGGSSRGGRPLRLCFGGGGSSASPSLRTVSTPGVAAPGLWPLFPRSFCVESLRQLTSASPLICKSSAVFNRDDNLVWNIHASRFLINLENRNEPFKKTRWPYIFLSFDRAS